MIIAQKGGGDIEVVTYNAAIDATSFAFTDFLTLPANEFPTGIAQDGPEGLQLQYSSDISSDATLTYSGDTPGIVTPQTIALT